MSFCRNLVLLNLMWKVSLNLLWIQRKLWGSSQYFKYFSWKYFTIIPSTYSETGPKILRVAMFYQAIIMRMLSDLKNVTKLSTSNRRKFIGENCCKYLRFCKIIEKDNLLNMCLHATSTGHYWVFQPNSEGILGIWMQEWFMFQINYLCKLIVAFLNIVLSTRNIIKV